MYPHLNEVVFDCRAVEQSKVDKYIAVGLNISISIYIDVRIYPHLYLSIYMYTRIKSVYIYLSICRFVYTYT